jgi:hypothetical protein
MTKRPKKKQKKNKRFPKLSPLGSSKFPHYEEIILTIVACQVPTNHSSTNMSIRQTLVTSFFESLSPGFQNPSKNPGWLFLLPLFAERKTAQICSKLAANPYQFCHFSLPK